MNLLRKLWHDDLGVIISAELVMVATILVLGLITGLTCLQGAIVDEYRDLAGAFRALDQSYYIRGMRGCFSSCGRSSRTFGSSFSDNQVVVLPDDIDIVPCLTQPAVPATPGCPINDSLPLDGLPCDACPIEGGVPQCPPSESTIPAEPQGPQPAPVESVPAQTTSVRTANAAGAPAAGPRCPG
ncbi:MAG: hypothetical protein ACKVT0_01630 [Planctomycetaceae bacterium]